jgi:hypothetical protein
MVFTNADSEKIGGVAEDQPRIVEVLADLIWHLLGTLVPPLWVGGLIQSRRQLLENPWRLIARLGRVLGKGDIGL